MYIIYHVMELIHFILCVWLKESWRKSGGSLKKDVWNVFHQKANHHSVVKPQLQKLPGISAHINH